MNWQQLKGLIRLRYQLSKNQILKAGGLNAALYTAIFAIVVLFSIFSFVSTAFGGAPFLKSLGSDRIILVWNIVTVVFLGSTLFDFISRVQKNDVVDIDRLLHLPMTLRGAFALNYVTSLVSLNMIMIAPAILGLAIAMPFAKDWPTAIAIPLSLAFLFMVTALTYMLRGFFAGLAKNKRTKGWMMIILPFVAIGLFLGMMELFETESIFTVLSASPLGFLASGVDSANQHASVLPGLFGTVCMTIVGCGSLYFAYRASLKKHTGDDVTRGKRAKAESQKWELSRQFKQLPLTSQGSSAVAKATMKSLMRAPEVLAAIIPAIAAFILGGPYLLGTEGYVIPEMLGTWLPVGVVMLTMIGFPAFLFSTYSYDRDGFRAYVLSPLNREDILHGKNLAIGIPTVLSGWICLLILQVCVPLNFFWFLGMLFQIPACYFLLCLIGHSLSISLPIGLKRGSMQPVNAKVIPAIALYVGVLIGPALAIVPTFIVYGIFQIGDSYFSFPLAWIFVLVSVIQLAVSWIVYRNCLKPLAAWLWNREPEILEVVANIPE